MTIHIPLIAGVAFALALVRGSAFLYFCPPFTSKMIPFVAQLGISAGLAVAAVPVLSRDPLRMAVVNGMYGLVLTLLFVALGAPDVALSMIVVGAVAYPLVVLIAIARSRS